jgi:undecaprenyl-diphosphatase
VIESVDLSWFQAVVLGAVEGITEFIPISSSGHLRIVPSLFGWPDPGAAFTAVTQLGTVLALLIFFARDLWRIASAWTRSLWMPAMRGDHDARMGWYIIIGTIPVSVLGLVFKDSIESTFRNLALVSVALIVMGVLLYVIDRVCEHRRQVEDVTLTDGIYIGLAQALALIPGVSRSGATITAGRLLRFDRAAAARFSFLLSVPAITLSGLYEARHLTDPGGGPSWGPTLLATVVAFVVGYASIAWLLRYLVKHTMLIFAGYRVVLGVLLLLLIATGHLATT